MLPASPTTVEVVKQSSQLMTPKSAAQKVMLRPTLGLQKSTSTPVHAWEANASQTALHVALETMGAAAFAKRHRAMTALTAAYKTVCSAAPTLPEEGFQNVINGV
ncbi:hypothetical protein CBR_g32171 [Chara braunii]|uniref:Uncharacterized protein n=1 Tax=Chara braunii TaxID=69332 RepID=A0A388JN16_CHABU|nr:hypothetical protein CBR_g32171 [Chara braunii]|eukprot:GBG59155.1 hypothetical protein CBR_g32171 [Chara braunii]